MAQVFPLNVSFGTNVTLSFPHELTQTQGGFDIITAWTIQPTVEFDISRAFITESQKSILQSFFQSIQGNQELFLFNDVSDNYAPSLFTSLNSDDYPTMAGYERGVIQGVVASDREGGNLRLFKEYKFFDGPAVVANIKRPIYYTFGQVFFYDQTGIVLKQPQPTFDPETGIVTGNIQAGDTWDGHFYVPVRFMDDEINFTKISNCLYSFNNRIREVKLNYNSVDSAFAVQYPHYFSIYHNFNSETRKSFKTDVFTADNQFESREQQYSQLQERFTLTNRKLLGQSDIDYLIALYRTCLGGFGTFQYYGWDVAQGSEPTFQASFDSPLQYTVVAENNNFDYMRYEVNDLVYKKANLTNIDAFRKPYCRCWSITRKDGGVVAYTDHDQTLVVEGTTLYTPSGLVRGADYNKNSDLDVKNTEIEGVFDSQITENDVRSGRYSGAIIRVVLVDWAIRAEAGVLFNGFIGNVSTFYTQQGYRKYKFEVLSLARNLNRNVSKLTSKRCRHKFLSQGYGNCNLSFSIDSTPTTSNSNVATRTTIASVVNSRQFSTATSGDWSAYDNGIVLFETGRLEGKQFVIDSGSSGVLNILFSFLIAPEVGDQILVIKDCKKTVDACVAYGNIANFGGQPRLPGRDVVSSSSAG